MPSPTVLLTGATGFLGSHILEALLNTDHNVIVLKRSTSNLWRIEHLMNQISSYDVDSQSIEQVFEEHSIDCVIHTACHYGRNGDSINKVVKSNLMFGLQVLEACIGANASTFINTDTLLGSHINAYALSKKQFVEYLKLQSEKIQVINLKLEHMYGPNDDSNKLVPWLLSRLKDNASEVKLTSGEQERDFIYISDVVSAFLMILKNCLSHVGFCEFEVGTGSSIPVKEFINLLNKTYIEKFGESGTKLVFGALPYREEEVMRIEVSNEPLLQMGWSPKVDLSTGLKKTVESINVSDNDNCSR